MKRFLRYTIASLSISFMFLFVGSKVSAADYIGSEVWETLGDYDVVNGEGDGLYDFNKKDEKYNYTFSYSYTIKTKGYLRDGDGIISSFYGLKSSTSISYEDLKGSLFGGFINDSFVAYKYNLITRDFSIVHNNGENKSGSYTISSPGIYKLETLGTDGQDKVAYIVYENKLYSASVNKAEFNNTSNPSIDVELIVKDPRKLSSCSISNVSIDSFSIANPTCQISLVSNEYGVYKVNLGLNAPLTTIKNGDLKFNLLGVALTFNDIISFDTIKPSLVSNKFYNSKLILGNFNKSYTTGGMSITPDASLVLKVSDSSLISRASINDVACMVSGGSTPFTVTCELKDVTNASSLNIKVYDEYDNLLSIVYNNITFDSKVLDDEDELLNHINILNNSIISDFNSSDYSDIEKLCVFYGRDASTYECDSATINSLYAYTGPLKVLVLDKALNFEILDLDEVAFNNGYLKDNFTISNIEGNSSYRQTVDFNRLIEKACSDNSECLSSVKRFVKYGNNVEEFNENQLPNYLEILNKKYKDSTCALNSCDKEVEVYINYDVGGSEQTLSMYYNYIDKLPHIQGELDFDDNVVLNYDNFDIESNEVINSLYGDNLVVNLIDSESKNYQGVISPVFVSYTNRDRITSSINNEPYTYIATVNEFGYYLLECRIKLTKNITDGIDYDNEIFAKSFFIEVELKDNVLPTLSLLGEKDVTVKQYDVYKDDGVKCEDNSGCSVTISYYFNDENNKVEEINTKIVGKYIIKYVAMDGDRNTVTSIRTVTVISANSLDITSIIIIVSVVVLFILFIVMGTVIEVKRSRKNRGYGEE